MVGGWWLGRCTFSPAFYLSASFCLCFVPVTNGLNYCVEVRLLSELSLTTLLKKPKEGFKAVRYWHHQESEIMFHSGKQLLYLFKHAVEKRMGHDWPPSPEPTSPVH